MTHEELAARAEITDVLMRYYRGMDRDDRELIAATFFEDAELDYGPMYRGDLAGLLSSENRPFLTRTMHFAGNVLIELDGDDVAHTETYAIAHHTAREPHPWAGAFVVVHMRYLDRFERRDGRWAVARRHALYEWVRKEPLDTFVEMPDEALGRRDRQDAVYRREGASR